MKKLDSIGNWYAFKPVTAFYTVPQSISVQLAKAVFLTLEEKSQHGLGGYDYMDYHVGIKSWIDGNKKKPYSSLDKYKEALIAHCAEEQKAPFDKFDIEDSYIEAWAESSDFWSAGNFAEGSVDAFFRTESKWLEH